MFPFKVCSGTTTNLEEEHKPWLLHIVSFVGSAVLVDVVALGTSVGRPHDAHTAMLPKNPTQNSIRVITWAVSDGIFNKAVYKWVDGWTLSIAQCAVCTVGSPCIQNPPVYDTGG